MRQLERNGVKAMQSPAAKRCNDLPNIQCLKGGKRFQIMRAQILPLHLHNNHSYILYIQVIFNAWVG